MEVPPESHVLNTTSFWTWIEEDGIARTKVKPNSQVTLEHAQENTEAVNALTSLESFPLIVDTTQIGTISKEARKHFSMNNRTTRVNALALLIDSRTSMVIGNFFIEFNKPKVPTKLFVNEEKALKWISKYKI